MFHIVPALESDVRSIIDIAERTWWPAYSNILPSEQIRYMLNAIYDPALLKSQIREGTQKYLLLIAEDKHEAFASFGMRPEDHAVFKIHKLYVLPDNQKKGYGRALINHIRQQLSDAKYHALDLNVNRFNPARHFYERIGFKIIREEDVPVGPYWMNDYVMRLQL